MPDLVASYAAVTRILGTPTRRCTSAKKLFKGFLQVAIIPSSEALKDGMLTLAASARFLVNEGETSVDEMMRMTSMD